MSKTLFWYLFKDLLRIFFLASGALAGIMSFAGLLRPLTENGLDLGQVNRILRYMSPAMTTYSLPVAALFATTVVYGRFAADNEFTAMRAGGISYLSMRKFSVALPALVLGLLAAMISLVSLCFVVPHFSLKVEEVIYSNIAKVIASKIEKNHEVDFRGASDGDVNVFAQSASLLPGDPHRPMEQSVELIGPAIVSYENPDPDAPEVRVPKEFWMARSAIVTITRSGGAGTEGSAELSVRLVGGIKFPRHFAGNVQAGVADTTFGPIDIPSLINENVKFLTLPRLQRLADHPSESQKMQVVLHDISRREEEQAFLDSISKSINQRDSLNSMGVDAHCTMTVPALSTESENDTYTIGGNNVVANQVGNDLIISGPQGGPAQGVLFRQAHGSQVTLAAKSKEVHIRVKSDVPNKQMAVSVELYDTQLQTGDVKSNRLSFIRSFNVPMSSEMLTIENKPLAEYKHDPLLSSTEVMALRHEQIVVYNSVCSELHSRASFALSCLILVMVGCALGVMFKSGNFLTAFAVSFVPALLVITLIVCGQQMSTHVPFDMGPTIRDPLHMALWFIWIGNIIVLGTAAYLTARLQKR